METVMAFIIGIVIIFFPLLIFLFARAELLMMFFQQDEYNNSRFLRFTFKNLKLVDKQFTCVMLVIAIIVTYLELKVEFFSGGILSGFIYLVVIVFWMPLRFAFKQWKLVKNARKALVMTARVKRVLTVYTILAICALLCTLLLFRVAAQLVHLPSALRWALSSILLVQLAPFLIVLSNILLSPYEKWTQRKFLAEAKAKLAQINPTIIGITGSYGKTSTKHILAHITSSSASIFFPPGGVNTPMGITRVIREKLKPEHKFFVSEMGAYGRGSIKRLCDLTPPTHGILTAVGKMHYERFKTQDTVAEAKFELAEAVFKKGGKFVINADLVKQEYIDRFTAGHREDVILVSRSPHEGYTTYIISNEQLTVDGIKFTFNFNGTAYEVQAPVYGMHQISNIAEAFVMATILGIAPETIVAAIKTLPQITHRLEVFKKQDAAIVIDDTYNSNPVGFRSALGVLNVLKREGGRTILVSPGMVELGEVHEQEHFEIGKEIGQKVDVFVAVIPKRIKSLIDGFKSTADLSRQQLIEIDTANEATNWANTNASALDVVLYENNNLPDLYESKVSI